MKKRIGVLTGGGDAPGLNPAIKAVTYLASHLNYEVKGILDGWEGLYDEHCDELVSLTPTVVRTWDRDGGTNLGSSRENPFKTDKKTGKDRSKEVIRNIEKLGFHALIAMGGEDTLGVASKLFENGINVVGIPKTIDKDLPGTDYTLGFDTALKNCTDYIEKSRTCAGSHHWVQVVEVMGRHAGHLALWSGIAGGASTILIPEHPFNYQTLYRLLEKRLHESKKKHLDAVRYSVIVVAEGAMATDGHLVTYDKTKDAFGHVKLGGIGNEIAERIRKDTRFESRGVTLGHPQRGGSPSATDRIMGFMFGNAAVEAIQRKQFGSLISAKGIAPACSLRLTLLSVVREGLNLVDVRKYYDIENYAAKRTHLLNFDADVLGAMK